MSKTILSRVSIEPLGIPSFVETPLIGTIDRDRLAVAFGLCADEDWIINYPDEIEDFTVERSDFSVRFVSSEQM